ncbi:MAG: hypothetical protein JNL66_04430 [Alphaproteobacteria bacterium]|nr:hypothetical protein [Alphaproteobacteria bacterium]
MTISRLGIAAVVLVALAGCAQRPGGGTAGPGVTPAAGPAAPPAPVPGQGGAYGGY